MASSKTASSKKVGRLVASRRKELAALDDEFFAEVVGVAQAIDALRRALSKISMPLEAPQYEKASALGFKEVASEFVFLQRTLGGLQGACLEKERLVQDLAFALRCPYEDVLPKVDALLASTRPIDRRLVAEADRGGRRQRESTRTDIHHRRAISSDNSQQVKDGRTEKAQ